MKRIHGCMTWSCRGGFDERRWGNVLWCEYASAFVGPASRSASLLWVRMFTISAWVNGPAMLECGAVLASGCAPRARIPAFGVSTFLTFPAPLSPVLGNNFLVELLACGLMLIF